MLSLLVQCLLLFVLFVHLNCEVYQNQPKIKTSDGDQKVEAALSVHSSVCGQTTFNISESRQVIRSPGYRKGSVPRGLHCAYELLAYGWVRQMIHIRINRLDLKPADVDLNQCNTDKFVVSPRKLRLNVTADDEGEFIHKYDTLFFSSPYYYFENLNLPRRFELCGNQSSYDFYLYGSVVLDLYTYPNTELEHYKGFEVEVAYVGDCSRNYTEPQGRIQGSQYDLEGNATRDCFTLITAPVNYTISAYFIDVDPNYWYDGPVGYLQVFDGKTISAPSLAKMTEDYPFDNPVFSTGNHLLLRAYQVGMDRVGYDLNYVITNKGRGCGGKLSNPFGRVTSPLYPNTYRQTNTCEWELETPANTKLRLRFSKFHLGVACDQNYVKLVKRNGDTISTHCENIPADYTSDDNYLRIVFTTTLNNGGRGWIANFIGTPSSVTEK